MINRDFKPRLEDKNPSSKLWMAVATLSVIASVSAIGAINFLDSQSADHMAPVNLQPNESITLTLALPKGEESVTAITPAEAVALTPDQPDLSQLVVHADDSPAPDLRWSSHTIKAGESLSKIFSNLGLSARTLYDIMQLGGATRALKRVLPGQKLEIATHPDGQLQTLVYNIDATQILKVNRADYGFDAQLEQKPIESILTSASTSIQNSLFLDGKEAGLSDKTLMELANIFGWDIDFALDLRQGDNFTLLYEARYIDGRQIKDGPILAAEFTNQGKPYRAIRYTDASGNSSYFTPEGKSMRKTFLRTPIELARISSRFNLKRKHPVLNRVRAHKGVDYAAGTGTPIRATGDGKIAFRGVKGGYGRVVVVQHGQKYSTLYAHMSKYGKYRKGTAIKQGQVIGYVGKSGLATGAHLHYEFRVNGVHRNPLTVKIPAAAPINPALLADFRKQSEPLLAKLELAKRPVFAQN